MPVFPAIGGLLQQQPSSQQASSGSQAFLTHSPINSSHHCWYRPTQYHLYWDLSHYCLHHYHQHLALGLILIVSTMSSAHPSCMDYSEDLAKRARNSPWQCIDCKTCYVCEDSGDPVSASSFIDELLLHLLLPSLSLPLSSFPSCHRGLSLQLPTDPVPRP